MKNKVICKCKSYNKNWGSTPNVILDLPDWMLTYKENRTVAVDACIVHVIKYLWDKKIETEGCCCGHNRFKPHLIISSGYNDKKIIRVFNIIKEIDDREWDICQWRVTRLKKKNNKILMKPIGLVWKP